MSFTNKVSTELDSSGVLTVVSPVCTARIMTKASDEQNTDGIRNLIQILQFYGWQTTISQGLPVSCYRVQATRFGQAQMKDGRVLPNIQEFIARSQTLTGALLDIWSRCEALISCEKNSA